MVAPQGPSDRALDRRPHFCPDGRLMSSTSTTALDVVPPGPARLDSFRIVWFFFLSAFLFEGFFNVIFGVTLSNNVSAFFMYGALIAVSVLYRLVVPNLLITLYVLIFFQTFIWKFHAESFDASLIQFLGIGLMSFTAFTFIRSQGTRIARIVNAYYVYVIAISALAVAQSLTYVVFGVLPTAQALLGSVDVTGARLGLPVFGIFQRAIGLSSEPHHLAMALLPGVYLAIKVLLGSADFLTIKSKRIAALIILAMILTFSSIAYLAMATILAYQLLMRSKRRLRTMAIVLACLIPVGAALSTQSTGLKILRLFSAVGESRSFNYSSTDLSGFALISNALVTFRSLVDNHFTGTGLKTHELSYQKYMPQLFLPSQVLMQLNSVDAGSLYLRLLSEFGIPGFLLFWWFLARYKLKPDSDGSTYRAINDMCMMFMVFQALRTGNYLSPELWLFIGLYYYSYQLQRQDLMQLRGPPTSEAPTIGC
jgi:O-Antigen ligase